mgnify:CR=1 FL=1
MATSSGRPPTARQCVGTNLRSLEPRAPSQQHLFSDQTLAVATVILLVLFVLMWIVLIVPRQRELKRHSRLLAELAVGDEIMMGAGIYGVIRAIDGEHVRLEVADGVELKVAKRAVVAKVTGEDEQAAPGTAGGSEDGSAGEPESAAAGTASATGEDSRPGAA